MNEIICLTLATNLIERVLDEKVTLVTITENLEKLDKNKSGKVVVELTKSKCKFVFKKMHGIWGAVDTNGNWLPFAYIPYENVDEMANTVRKVLNNEQD